MEIVSIECRGETHRIGWYPQGDLVFLDHDLRDLYDEMDMLISMGDFVPGAYFRSDETTSRCAQALILWRMFSGSLALISEKLATMRMYRCRRRQRYERDGKRESGLIAKAQRYKEYGWERKRLIRTAIRRAIRQETKRIGWEERFYVRMEDESPLASFVSHFYDDDGESAYRIVIGTYVDLWHTWREHRTLIVRVVDGTHDTVGRVGILIGYYKLTKSQDPIVALRNTHPLEGAWLSARIVKEVEFLP